MNRELCLVICFFVGIVAFYLLKQGCGCKTVEGVTPMSCKISSSYIGSRDRQAVIKSCEAINDSSKIDTNFMSAEKMCITGGLDPTGKTGDCSWGVPSDSANPNPNPAPAINNNNNSDPPLGPPECIANQFNNNQTDVDVATLFCEGGVGRIDISGCTSSEKDVITAAQPSCNDYNTLVGCCVTP